MTKGLDTFTLLQFFLLQLRVQLIFVPCFLVFLFELLGTFNVFLEIKKAK